jgi:hypothetical protein
VTAEFWCGKEGGPAKSSAEIVSRDAKDYGVPEGPDSDYDPVRPCSRLKPEVLRPVTSCLYDSGSHSHHLFPIPIPIPFPLFHIPRFSGQGLPTQHSLCGDWISKSNCLIRRRLSHSRLLQRVSTRDSSPPSLAEITLGRPGIKPSPSPSTTLTFSNNIPTL